jgi:hypothetical protein
MVLCFRNGDVSEFLRKVSVSGCETVDETWFRISLTTMSVPGGGALGVLKWSSMVSHMRCSRIGKSQMLFLDAEEVPCVLWGVSVGVVQVLVIHDDS